MVSNIVYLIMAGLVSTALGQINEFESKKMNGPNEKSDPEQYSYGMKTLLTAKQQSKSLDGSTSDTYSYIDSHGNIQKVNYAAEPHVDLRDRNSRNAEFGQSKGVLENSGKKQENMVEIKDFGRNGLKQDVRTQKDVKSDAIPTENKGKYDGFQDTIVAPLNLMPRLFTIPNVYYPFLYIPLIDFSGVLMFPPTFYQAIPQVDQSQKLSNVELKPDSYYNYGKNYQYFGKNLHGAYNYGYTNEDSAKFETKSLDGITRGGYSYWDSNGKLQSVSYEAGKDMGFRVMATNLPKSTVNQF